MNQLILFLISLLLIFLITFTIRNVSISLLIGALFLGLTTLDVTRFIENMLSVLLEHTTLLLIVISVLIVYFVNLYSLTRMIDESQNYIVSRVKRPKLLMMLVPAFIGLLPVAGGALLSAPFIDSMGSKLGIDAHKKSFINVWYRHTLLFAYPLSDVLILTSALASIKLIELLPLLILPMFVMIISGYLLTLKATQDEVISLNENRERYSFVPILPFFIAVSASVILTFILNLGLESIVIGVLSGIVSLIIIAKPKISHLLKSIKDKRILTIVILLYAAMLIRRLLIDTNIVSQINILSSIFPKATMLVTVPFFLGSILGSASGALAISFAVLSGVSTFTPTEAMLIYGSSFLGYTISPFHLCLIFTVEYLKGSLLRTYRYMLPACIMTILSMMVLTFLLNPTSL